MKTKLLIGAAALSILVGSGISYKLVTGKCPVGEICHYFHGGDAKAPAKTPAN